MSSFDFVPIKVFFSCLVCNFIENKDDIIVFIVIVRLQRFVQRILYQIFSILRKHRVAEVMYLNLLNEYANSSIFLLTFVHMFFLSISKQKLMQQVMQVINHKILLVILNLIMLFLRILQDKKHLYDLFLFL
jgi:hypothetical protein